MSDTAYTCACWDFLHGRLPTMPIATDFGLTVQMGDVLFRQVYCEYSAKCRRQPQTPAMRPRSSEMGPWSQKEVL